MPLIFNLAMKRYSFNNRQTVGNEQLADIHDYREYDLEAYYDESINFSLFAAEILFLRLWKSDNSYKVPIVPDELRSTEVEILKNRRTLGYKTKIIQAAKEFLPGYTSEKMAKEVFEDSILKNRLKKLLDDSLAAKNIKISSEKLFLPNYPQAGVIIPALLNRNISVEEILQEISALKEGNDNKFTGKTNWVHNNIIGCLLLIYEPLGRFCPFYSGFEAFCLMSRTNIRHFLELCNKSINNETLSRNTKSIPSISSKSQAEAAKHSSTSFLKEVKSFGVNGNSLHSFVLRTGTYFKWAHKRLSQSEPEQNHFSIQGNVSNEIQVFIEDAIKWSVLYESKITKQKGGASKLESEDFEYILNPIYAPYFHISYRKKRRVKFSEEDLKTIVHGDFEQFEAFLKSTLKAWNLVSKDDDLNLFSKLS
jgi:hypothetical protein